MSDQDRTALPTQPRADAETASTSVPGSGAPAAAKEDWSERLREAAIGGAAGAILAVIIAGIARQQGGLISLLVNSDTVGAALGSGLALWGAVFAERLRRRQQAEHEREQERQRYREVVEAVYGALDLLNEGIAIFRAARCKGGQPVIAAKARSRAGTLRLMASRPDLSDGAIDSLISAGTALETLLIVDENARSGSYLVARAELQAAQVIGRLSQERVAGVVRYRNVQVSTERRAFDVETVQDVDAGSSHEASPS